MTKLPEFPDPDPPTVTQSAMYVRRETHVGTPGCFREATVADLRACLDAMTPEQRDEATNDDAPAWVLQKVYEARAEAVLIRARLQSLVNVHAIEIDRTDAQDAETVLSRVLRRMEGEIARLCTRVDEAEAERCRLLCAHDALVNDSGEAHAAEAENRATIRMLRAKVEDLTSDIRLLEKRCSEADATLEAYQPVVDAAIGAFKAHSGAIRGIYGRGDGTLGRGNGQSVWALAADLALWRAAGALSTKHRPGSAGNDVATESQDAATTGCDIRLYEVAGAPQWWCKSHGEACRRNVYNTEWVCPRIGNDEATAADGDVQRSASTSTAATG